MTMFADFRRDHWVSYFNDHGDALLQGRAEFAAAAEKYAKILRSCGAHESPHFQVSGFVEDALDTSDRYLPEELARYLTA